MAQFHGYNGCHRYKGSNEVAINKINGRDSSSSSDKEFATVTKLKVMNDIASQKHALSERKRRKRINGHYDSLRQFFPRQLKSDKASVLTETVRRIKELKGIIADINPSHGDTELCSGIGSRRSFFIPGENDKATVNYCNDGNKATVQAIICCDDRLSLNQDLMEAIQSVGGKGVKAEMATIGGRTKVEVVVEWLECGYGSEEDVGLLRRALKAVVENQVLGRTRFVGRQFTEPEFDRLGQRPDVCNKIQNGLADELVVTSY